MNKQKFLLLIIFMFCITTICFSNVSIHGAEDKKYTIVNPYETIDWNEVQTTKAALHVHTSNSGVVWNDGNLSSPDAVIKGYQNAGFGALVITDHDFVSYPWSHTESFDIPRNVNTENSSLLSIPGNELSKHANVLAYGVDYFDRYDPEFVKNQSISNGIDANIANVGALGGITYIAHPRRNDPFLINKDKGENVDYSDLFWLKKFNDNESLRGIEVFNAGQFSNNHSERLWDSLLTKSCPSRVIYGTASDDNHGGTSYDKTTSLGRGYTQLLLMPDKLNSEGVFDALKYGKTYFSTYCIVNNIEGTNDDNKARPNTPAPTIESIVVDNSKGTITLKTKYATSVDWISGYDANNASSVVIRSDVANNAVEFTSTFNVETADNLANYVRIRIYGDGGQTHTQPFALKKYYPTLVVSDNDVTVDYSQEKILFDDENVEVSLKDDFSSLLSSPSELTPSTTLYARKKALHPDQEVIVRQYIISARPNTPSLSLNSRKDSMIKISSINGAQYRINDGPWQDVSTFNNLSPDTTYRIEARIKATEQGFASEIASKEFTTKEAVKKEGCQSKIMFTSIPVIIIFFGFGILFNLKVRRRTSHL